MNLVNKIRAHTPQQNDESTSFDVKFPQILSKDTHYNNVLKLCIKIQSLRG